MAFADPISGGEQVADDLISFVSKFVTDKDKAAELVAGLQDKYLSAAQASDQTQATIMAAEAAQQGWFNKPHIAGAWVCLGALVLDALIGFGIFISYAVGHPIPEPPKFMSDQISTLMGGLFSLGSVTVLHQGYKQWMAAP